MLYVVECAYTDPQSEAAWNTFTIRKTTGAGLCARFLRLPALPRSQRGLPLLPGAARYPRCYRHRQRRLPPQRRRPFTRWQSAIADWHRHLFLTNNTLREVAPDEVLLLGDTAEDLPVAAPILLQPGGLATEQTRYAAILPRDNLHHRPRLPPSISISPSPPGYATRRSAREVAMSPAPFIR